MQIENSNYSVKFSSVFNKEEVFQFISSGFFFENFRRVFVVYLRANFQGKLFTYEGKIMWIH